MPNYRRLRIFGGTYFFTIVTHGRRRFLTDPGPRSCLRRAIERTQVDRPFLVAAIVLLPDHFHCIWKLPAGCDDFSARMSIVKRRFTIDHLSAGAGELRVSESRRRKRERGVWQRRFWEHAVRDDDELHRIVDYIHWNPVKHGLVARPSDWPWSSFHRYVANGTYDRKWGDPGADGLDASITGGDDFA